MWPYYIIITYNTILYEYYYILYIIIIVATAYTIGIIGIHNVPETNNSVSVSVYLFTAIKHRNYYRFTKSLAVWPTNRKMK